MWHTKVLSNQLPFFSVRFHHFWNFPRCNKSNRFGKHSIWHSSIQSGAENALTGSPLVDPRGSPTRKSFVNKLWNSHTHIQMFHSLLIAFTKTKPKRRRKLRGHHKTRSHDDFSQMFWEPPYGLRRLLNDHQTWAQTPLERQNCCYCACSCLSIVSDGDGSMPIRRREGLRKLEGEQAMRGRLK